MKNYKTWPHQQSGALRAPLLPAIVCTFSFFLLIFPTNLVLIVSFIYYYSNTRGTMRQCRVLALVRRFSEAIRWAAQL